VSLRNGKKYKKCHLAETEEGPWPPLDLNAASVENIPEASRLLKCAAPVIITNPEAPDYPGVNGTCFAIRRGHRIVFLTAGHVVRKATNANVEVATGFGAERSLCRIAKAVYPEPVAEEVVDACDLAVLVPVAEPVLDEDDVVALVADEVADMTRAPQHALFAYAGYPREGERNSVDYDNRTIHFELFHGFGTYSGPARSMTGCHTLKLIGAPANGLQGVSGSPVIRVVFDREHGTKVGLASLAIREGSSLLHFVDVAHLIALLVIVGY
jgi:hypothetical protein